MSVVAPAHNEEENLRPLVEEIIAALEPARIDYEILIVDDGSTDGTAKLLEQLMAEYPRLRAIRMAVTPPGRGNGQSAAFHAGFRASRGDLIAVLDADLQNDPRDIPVMLNVMEQTGADLVQGDRSQNRRDHAGRKLGWLVGLTFRRVFLGDMVRDTGCSLRLMRREVALAIPLEFRGMHRFIPFLARNLGYRVVETPVRHRPRVAGTAKYGTFDRAIPALVDCLAVRWMTRRRRPVEFTEISSAKREARDSHLTEPFPLPTRSDRHASQEVCRP